jgi:hypothetical protein
MPRVKNLTNTPLGASGTVKLAKKEAKPVAAPAAKKAEPKTEKKTVEKKTAPAKKVTATVCVPCSLPSHPY